MTQAKVLADRIYTGEGIAPDAVRILAANILLILCAHIAIPLPWTPVPITLAMYLLEGMAGLPVFAPIGAPALARFFGPTAGYLFAYPPAAFLTGWLVERDSSVRFLRFAGTRLAGALFSGEALIFAGGCAWLALGMGLGWSRALAAGLLPFLPGEIFKMLLIVAAVRGVELARMRK